jgi:plasmid stabilization system protein ParE
MNPAIKWNKKALVQLDEAIKNIEKESVQNAEKVELDILTKIGKIPTQPERYPKDKFKVKNDGSFRAFELHHYRISYRYIKNEIRILRIRHTSRCPKLY